MFMKNIIIIAVAAILFFLSCTSSHSNTIPEQLQSNFSAHAAKIDSSLILDSFRLVRVDTLVEKLGRIIDDTIYKREFYRIQSQLQNAVKEQKKDSIAIYQDEINYMLPQIDSITKSIPKGDTTKIFGILASCNFWLKKNDKKNNGVVYYFLDRKMNILNADRIDSTIAIALNQLK
jgi:hypothetical protein